MLEYIFNCILCTRIYLHFDKELKNYMDRIIWYTLYDAMLYAVATLEEKKIFFGVPKFMI